MDHNPESDTNDCMGNVIVNEVHGAAEELAVTPAAKSLDNKATDILSQETAAITVKKICKDDINTEHLNGDGLMNDVEKENGENDNDSKVISNGDSNVLENDAVIEIEGVCHDDSFVEDSFDNSIVEQSNNDFEDADVGQSEIGTNGDSALIENEENKINDCEESENVVAEDPSFIATNGDVVNENAMETNGNEETLNKKSSNEGVEDGESDDLNGENNGNGILLSVNDNFIKTSFNGVTNFHEDSNGLFENQKELSDIDISEVEIGSETEVDIIVEPNCGPSKLKQLLEGRDIDNHIIENENGESYDEHSDEKDDNQDDMDTDETSLPCRRNLRDRQLLSRSIVMDSDEDSFPEPAPPPSKKKLKSPVGKRNYRRQRPYTDEQLQSAIDEVISNELTLVEASETYRIPRSSLNKFVLRHKRGEEIIEPAVSAQTYPPSYTYLTNDEEKEIEAMIKRLARCGKRYSNTELRFLVQFYLDTHDRPVFKSGTLPTMGWIAGLLERNESLLDIRAKKTCKADLKDIDAWHDDITDHLISDWEVEPDIMFQNENKERIFCYQAFRLSINGPAVGEVKAVKREPGMDDPTEEVGVIIGSSVGGNFMTPLVVLPEEKKDESIGKIDETLMEVRYTPAAKVDADIGLKLVKDLDARVTEAGVEKPIIYFVTDKQDMAHFSVIDYCWENQIIIVCLPPRTNKNLAPFDLGIWPKIRTTYNLLWKDEPKGFDCKMKLDRFPSLFSQAWKTASDSNLGLAKKGFIKSGIFPFNVPEAARPEGGQITPLLTPKKEDLVNKKSTQSKQSNLSSFHPVKESPSSMQNSSFNFSFSNKPVESQEDFNRGQLEGIKLCLKAMEECIEPDIKPVWEKRVEMGGSTNRCELSYKLWRAVTLLYKADCALASIRDMAVENSLPLSFDNILTYPKIESRMPAFTPSEPKPNGSAKSNSIRKKVTKPKEKPDSFISLPVQLKDTANNKKQPIKTESSKKRAPVTKEIPVTNAKKKATPKRKLNKSIYSDSSNGECESSTTAASKKSKSGKGIPFVKVHDTLFLNGTSSDE